MPIDKHPPRQNKKQRLDVLLYERGLAASREAGRRLVMAGEVLVNGEVAAKPGQAVAGDAEIMVKAEPRFVSRGGDKLSAALEEFRISPRGWACADVGASTGGFTDCLLKSGARAVYAIDVGYGQLAWPLRQDSRVVVMERINARYLESLPEKIDFACIDASFISLKLLVPVVHRWLAGQGQIVALVKPQFEAGRERVGKGGVVRDAAVHSEVLHDLVRFVVGEQFTVGGLIPSPIKGPSGNVEFLLWLAAQAPKPVTEAGLMISEALRRASEM